MGFIVAPARKAEAQDVPAGDDGRARKRELRARAAVRDGAGRLRLRDQPARHLRPTCSPATTPCCRRATTRCSCPRWLRAGPARRSRRRGGPSSTASAPPAAPGPSWPAWSRRCSTACSPAAGAAGDGRRSLDALLDDHGFDREQHEQIRADLRRGRIGLAQNRLPASTRHRGRAAGRRDRRPTSAADAISATRRAARPLARGRGGGGHARRRGGQPLDAGGGRGQGAAPVLQARRAAPHVPRGPPGQEPPQRPRSAARRCRTSSPPATSRTTRSPRYLAARGQLRLPRRRCCSRRGGRSGCGWCRWSATCASPGRRCRSSCSTSRRRRCATACTRR